MKRKLPILLLLLSAFCVGFAAQPRRAAWEYTTAEGTYGKPAELNKLGAEGWELVHVESTGLSAVYFFKRPK